MHEHKFVRLDQLGTRRSASILHADLDSFYASVEQRDNPQLQGKTVAVGGGGVILAASYEAKRLGVRTPMPGYQARRLCPGLIMLPPRFEAYTAASRDVFEIFNNTTPLVEGISVDEAFLDVAGLGRLSGTPVEVAQQLRAEVRKDVGLAITVGVARTKFLAKVASGVGKPDGLLLVEPDGELDFLHPLPVERLWGVGAVTAAKLNARGISTVGEVAEMPLAALDSIVGAGMARQLHALANNHDPRVVEVGRRRGSIGSQQALGRRSRSHAEIEVVLSGLVDRIARRMRRANRVGRTVVLRLRFDDFSRATRSHSMPACTSSSAPIQAISTNLLAMAWPTIEERGLTLIGVAVSNLRNEYAVQLALPFERIEAEQLDTAIDDVRDRFGGSALTWASTIGNDADFSVPMLSD
ncbi:MAG: DNA polymerase IV [Ilumatobacteraceae bacterium]|nr:DNA polymerase IV [Ilumatobacteraceae bacterium]